MRKSLLHFFLLATSLLSASLSFSVAGQPLLPLADLANRIEGTCSVVEGHDVFDQHISLASNFSTNEELIQERVEEEDVEVEVSHARSSTGVSFSTSPLPQAGIKGDFAQQLPVQRRLFLQFHSLKLHC